MVLAAAKVRAFLVASCAPAGIVIASTASVITKFRMALRYQEFPSKKKMDKNVR
jgi:hypothetical protein